MNNLIITKKINNNDIVNAHNFIISKNGFIYSIVGINE